MISKFIYGTCRRCWSVDVAIWKTAASSSSEATTKPNPTSTLVEEDYEHHSPPNSVPKFDSSSSSENTKCYACYEMTKLKHKYEMLYDRRLVLPFATLPSQFSDLCNIDNIDKNNNNNIFTSISIPPYKEKQLQNEKTDNNKKNLTEVPLIFPKSQKENINNNHEEEKEKEKEEIEFEEEEQQQQQQNEKKKMHNVFDHITGAEISSLPLVSYSGPIYWVTDKEKLDFMMTNIYRDKIIAIDTETKPHFKRKYSKKDPPCLVQIATKHFVFLMRPHKSSIKKELVNILSNPTILKVGIAIVHDVKDLQLLLPHFTPKSVFDLQKAAKCVNIPRPGLQPLIATLFHRKVSKAYQLSNWEQESLGMAQEKYAATDAWACLLIFQEFLKLHFIQTHGEDLLFCVMPICLKCKLDGDSDQDFLLKSLDLEERSGKTKIFRTIVRPKKRPTNTNPNKKKTRSENEQEEEEATSFTADSKSKKEKEKDVFEELKNLTSSSSSSHHHHHQHNAKKCLVMKGIPIDFLVSNNNNNTNINSLTKLHRLFRSYGGVRELIVFKKVTTTSNNNNNNSNEMKSSTSVISTGLIAVCASHIVADRLNDMLVPFLRENISALFVENKKTNNSSNIDSAEKEESIQNEPSISVELLSEDQVQTEFLKNQKKSISTDSESENTVEILNRSLFDGVAQVKGPKSTACPSKFLVLPNSSRIPDICSKVVVALSTSFSSYLSPLPLLPPPPPSPPSSQEEICKPIDDQLGVVDIISCRIDDKSAVVEFRNESLAAKALMEVNQVVAVKNGAALFVLRFLFR